MLALFQNVKEVIGTIIKEEMLPSSCTIDSDMIKSGIHFLGGIKQEINDMLSTE